MSRFSHRVQVDRLAPTVQTHGNPKTFSEMTLPVECPPSLPVQNTSKPIYRVPSMAEIAATPKNGYRIISTFSGCGGSCLGFEMAGYTVLWASEFIPAAQEVYRFNHPGVILDTRDIRSVQASDILAATGLEVGDIDVLEGSPPCASFSTAGKREAKWGKVTAYSDTAQRSDDLFFEFVRILDGLQPRVFVAENVSGLIKGTAKGYFKRILAAMKACGYRVEVKLLDAQWLGVPQMRQRIIFVGVRNDLGINPAFPMPLPYRYSVRDAIGIGFRTKSYAANDWIEGDKPAAAIQASGQYFCDNESIVGIETENGFNRHADYSVDRPMGTVQAGRPVRVSLRTMRDNRGAFGNGGEITDQPSPTELSDSVGTHWVEEQWGMITAGNERHTAAGRRPLHPLTEPSPTVLATAAGANLMNQKRTERRKFTIAELKRICAFPDDFILTGTYAQQWERLGRAVPPLMMRAVAETIRDEVLAKCKN